MTSSPHTTRRQFLQHAGLGLAAAGAVGALGARQGVRASEPEQTEHEMTVISGKPRERGRQYGEKFKQEIHAFLEKEIYGSFIGKPSAKDDLLRYAGACEKAVRKYSPTVTDELEGMAEGSGLSLEEHVLITLHEELHHRGDLPKIEHCTAVAAGPPDTKDGSTYVGQTWDWMQSVYGLSNLLHWKGPDGADLMAYAYPGLWAGAGMNAAGVALTWTSGDGRGIKGPRVGIPSYVLIAQMLYQQSLDDAVEEARRATHAGWFTFVMGDGEGNLVNVEGTPRELAVERHKGNLARVLLGSRQLTETPEGQPVVFHERCQKMYELMDEAKGQIDAEKLKEFFSSSCAIAHGGTIDAMIFDCTKRQAHLSRVRGEARRWKTYGLEG
jgi:isopenicillin-N N-acyltransferase-like protein